MAKPSNNVKVAHCAMPLCNFESFVPENIIRCLNTGIAIA